MTFELLLAALAIIVGLLMLKPLAVATADAVIHMVQTQDTADLPIAANETIYKGAWVGKNPAGYAKAFEAGDELVGLAASYATGGSTAGTYYVTHYIRGRFQFTLTSVALTDVGKPAFATADNTLALTGHPDAYVGRIVRYITTDTCLIELKRPGEVPRSGEGCVLIELVGHESGFDDLAAAGTTYVADNFVGKAIGAAGTPGVDNLDGEDGGFRLHFSTTAEVQTASIHQLNDCLPIDKGLTFEVELTVHDNGDTADGDLDFGFSTALTSNTLADMAHANNAELACFHCDGNDENVDAWTIKNSVATSITDTTVDNVADTYKKYKIIVRPDGTVEFWIAGVQVLSTTSFSMTSTALVAACLNFEKAANDTPGDVYFKKLRIGAGMAA